MRRGEKIGILLLAVFATAAAKSLFADDPYVESDPYRDILSDSNFRPKKEQDPGNRTIDQLITEAYGGLPMYMAEGFLDLTGDITVELDMVLTSEQYQAMYMKDSERSGRKKRKATRNLVYRWPDATIPYEFVTSHFNVDEIYYIKKAMERWEETTCVKFQPYTSTDKNRIRFQNGNGCNSQLGMNGYRGVQDINLQAPGCRFSGLYLHEIGHAIGLVHEHQLPDRDQYIQIIYDNVAPSMRQWFNKYATQDVNQYGVPFEYSSVMHYGVTAFSKDGYSQTIRARDPKREAEIGRVYLKGLSFTDIKVVNLMYDCNKHCSPDPNCEDPGYLDKNCKCVRPETVTTTTTTTTTTDGCSNIWGDAECQGWASSGECYKNPLWMKDNCKKACEACTDTDGDEDGGTTDGCVNAHDDTECQGWARDGECEANPEWMKGNCKKACKVCTDTDGGTTDEKECTNLWGDYKCQPWADSGECEANSEWMRHNCKKACKACPGTTTTTTSTCVDNDQYCESWARSGYCDSNWYTKENCKKSCGTCSGDGKTLKEGDTDTDTGSGSKDGGHGAGSGLQTPSAALLLILASFLMMQL